MEFKTKGDTLRVRFTNDDLESISWTLAYPIYMRFVSQFPDLAVKNIQSFSLELRGDILLTVSPKDMEGIAQAWESGESI